MLEDGESETDDEAVEKCLLEMENNMKEGV